MTKATGTTKTVKTNGKAAHLAACAAAKIEGDARRAAKKEAGLAKQAEYLANLKSTAAQAKADRIEAHQARNAQAKAMAENAKAANDDATATDVAA